MRKEFRRIGIVLVNIVLLMGLLGLLAAYLVVVVDLPSRVYTVAQREYLSYNYGRSITQDAPTLAIMETEEHVEAAILAPRDSRVRATLDARYEEREGVSVTVYDLEFSSEYILANSGSEVTATVALFFPFPSNLETLHEVSFLVDGEEPPEAQYTLQGVGWQTEMEAGEEHQIAISYRADGANSFSYGVAQGQRSDVLDVTVTVLGLEGSEVSRVSLPTTGREVVNGGETFTWDYTGLIANRDIRLTLPSRLSFAQRVAQLQGEFSRMAVLAPFLVGLFLASLAALLRLGDVRLGLESYLLMGCGLALFYPLLTFLSGMMDVVPAATLAFLVVSGLVLAFLALVAGWRRIWWRGGLLLVVFLGIFSLGMLTPWRGLLLTGGGLLLLGTFMVAYARQPRVTEPESVSAEAPEPEPLLETSPADAAPEAIRRHCPHCGRTLGEDHQFCPGCGRDIRHFRTCAKCGHEQFVSPDLKPVHCVRCGKLLR